MSAEFDYDPATDSLYIKLRPGLSVENRIVGDDVVIDLDADGEPVGYDIQHASQHADAIAQALAYLRCRFAAEAHRQSGAVAASPQEKEDQAFIDGISASAGTPRKRIDIAALRAATDATPMQPESAGDFVRRMRDEDRY
jgi:uncharacterized protein YuzE